MNSPTIIISQPQTKQDFDAYYMLRYEILRKPWNQPIGSEKDKMEADCIHLMACDENNTLLGVCRLQFNSETEAQLRYMAVRKGSQHTGVGKKLINYSEKLAMQKNADKLILQARDTAIEFYKKSGYSIVEKTYLMWNEIQHYLMEKKLTIEYK
ncbi:MAG: GNAT family N-acetyltransferase [Bacteroidia bacterium]